MDNRHRHIYMKQTKALCIHHKISGDQQLIRAGQRITHLDLLHTFGGVKAGVGKEVTGEKQLIIARQSITILDLLHRYLWRCEG